MKLIAFNTSNELKAPFLQYIEDWQNEPHQFGEDYAKMYVSFIHDYEVEMLRILTLKDDERQLRNLHQVWFYWLFDENENLLGTIRYRINIPQEVGNIGFEISPKHRKKGYGKLMLKLLLEELKKKEIKGVNLTVVKENQASIKVIEANKGVRKNTIYSDFFKDNLLIFEIKF